ncbi:RpiB/LacA/LacB family sugar-phosphate isomerase [Patescibacteria group bacterium]|nr:RpiB/LacA/LacB family sugar-phosphate isomerase [Patescibacteria group bacterium]
MSPLSSHVIIGTDHAGYTLKQALLPLLKQQGLTVEDLSPSLTPDDDYPLIAHQVAEKVTKASDRQWGILLCGSGIGVSIAANRHPSVRAALVRTATDAELARLDDQANVLVLGGRITKPEELPEILEAWLKTDPSSDPRHARRVAQIDQF